MGVGSNRVDVHRACAAAERALERRAEPLRALFLPADRSTRTRSPTIAWRNLVLQQRARLVVRVQRTTRSSTRCVVRYPEARQIGDGLDARRGARARRARSTRRAGATLVVNPTAARATGLVEVTRARATGPCEFVGRRRHGAPDAGRSARSAARRSPTMVTGQKVRWVLDLMRGTEFAGRQIASYEVTDGRRRRSHDIVLHEAGARRRRACDLVELKEQLLALGERGPTRMRVRLVAAPAAARRCSTPATIAGLRLVDASPRGDGRAAATGTADGALANEHLRVDVDPRRRHVHDRRPPTACASTGSGRLVDGGDGGDTYNYSPPDDRPRRRPARPRCASTTLETGPVRAARPDRRRLHAGRRTRSATRARARARSDETVRVTVRTTLELRAGERVPPRRARARQPRARPPAARALPAARAGRPAPTPSARSPSCTAGSPPRAASHEFGLPTFPSRRFVDASDGDGRASRSCTTACSSTRSSTTAASSRSRCCARSATSRAPSRRCARTRPARPIPLDGPQLLGRPARRVRGAAPPRRLARGRLLRRGRRVPRAVRARPRRGRRRPDAVRRPGTRCASTAPRCRPCCASPGGSSCASSAPTADAGPGDDRARRRARPRLGRRPPRPTASRRSTARSTLRPWEIATLRSLTNRRRVQRRRPRSTHAGSGRGGVGRPRRGSSKPASWNLPAGAKRVAAARRVTSRSCSARVGERGARLGRRRRGAPRGSRSGRRSRPGAPSPRRTRRRRAASAAAPRAHASSSSSASAHATPGAFVTNITASPMRFTTLAPDGRDHVAGRRLEAVRASSRARAVSRSCHRPGVAREVGEADRELARR